MKVSAFIQVATIIDWWMLPVHTDEFRLTAGNVDWSKLRIYQPEAKDDKELFFAYDNSKGSTPLETIRGENWHIMNEFQGTVHYPGCRRGRGNQKQVLH